MKHDEYLSPQDVAELLCVNAMTVRRMTAKGVINCITTPGGHRRYSREHIEEYCLKNNYPLPGPKLEKTTILIVDDEEDILEILTLFIETSFPSAEVITASGGFEAGVKLAEYSPSIVVTDLMMPDMNGIQVCKHIKTNTKIQETHVIGITGTTDQTLIDSFLAAGGLSCLNKPISKKEFTSILEKLI